MKLSFAHIHIIWEEQKVNNSALEWCPMHMLHMEGQSKSRLESSQCFSNY